jgi:hypothetical protein
VWLPGATGAVTTSIVFCPCIAPLSSVRLKIWVPSSA